MKFIYFSEYATSKFKTFWKWRPAGIFYSNSFFFYLKQWTLVYRNEVYSFFRIYNSKFKKILEMNKTKISLAKGKWNLNSTDTK